MTTIEEFLCNDVTKGDSDLARKFTGYIESKMMIADFDLLLEGIKATDLVHAGIPPFWSRRITDAMRNRLRLRSAEEKKGDRDQDRRNNSRDNGIDLSEDLHDYLFGHDKYENKHSGEAIRAKQSRFFLGRIALSVMRADLEHYRTLRDAGNYGAIALQRIILELYDSAKELEWESCLTTERALRAYRELSTYYTNIAGVDDEESPLPESTAQLTKLRSNFAIVVELECPQFEIILRKKMASRNHRNRGKGVVYSSKSKQLEADDECVTPMQKKKKKKGKEADRPVGPTPSSQSRRKRKTSRVVTSDDEDNQPLTKKTSRVVLENILTEEVEMSNFNPDEFPEIRKYKDGSTYRCKIVKDIKGSGLFKKDVSGNYYAKETIYLLLIILYRNGTWMM